MHFGFSTARALDCGAYYIYPDNVREIEITMYNQDDSNQVQDVTELFVAKYNSMTYSLEELIDRQSDERGATRFGLSLLEYDSIYKKSKFQINAILKSGKTFTKLTEEVIFKD